MPLRRTQSLLALLGAVLVAAATYLGLTEGLDRLSRTVAPVTATGPGFLPEAVFDPPETVRTTAESGPVGPVALVFADGSDGPAARWVAVSHQTGDYRALSAPHLPAARPDAVAVAPDGTALAWSYPDGVVLYDTVRDEARSVTDRLGPVRAVGEFSPDGRRVTAYDGRLHVLDAATGRVLGTLAGVDERRARQAVWTPDGTALSYLDGGALVTWRWAAGTSTRTPVAAAPRATLAWRPDGEQIAATRRSRFSHVVEVFDRTADGRWVPGPVVGAPAHSMQRLLGYSGDDTVLLLGLALDTGPLPKAYELPVAGADTPSDVMRLPDGHVARTVQVAAAPMRNGSHEFAEPDWPVSDTAKLVAAVVTGVFVLGLYLTRRRA